MLLAYAVPRELVSSIRSSVVDTITLADINSHELETGDALLFPVLVWRDLCHFFIMPKSNPQKLLKQIKMTSLAAAKKNNYLYGYNSHQLTNMHTVDVFSPIFKFSFSNFWQKSAGPYIFPKLLNLSLKFCSKMQNCRAYMPSSEMKQTNFDLKIYEFAFL